MKQITILNVTYKSFAAAFRDIGAEGVSWALARKRMSRGWSPYDALLEPPLPPQLRRAGLMA